MKQILKVGTSLKLERNKKCHCRFYYYFFLFTVQVECIKTLLFQVRLMPLPLRKIQKMLNRSVEQNTKMQNAFLCMHGYYKFETFNEPFNL